MPSSLRDQHWIEERIKKFRKKQQRNPNAYRILAHGDSWCNHFHGVTAISALYLEEDLNFVIIGSPGNELKDITRNFKHLYQATYTKWLKGHTYDLVLLSVAGNDLLGDMDELLIEKKKGLKNESLINKEVLSEKLHYIRKEYVRLLARIRQILPNAKIAAHGYDYPMANGKKNKLLGGLFFLGPWLEENFEKNGINDFDERQKIIKYCIDTINDMLESFEKNDSYRFTHINLRGTLTEESHWQDDIHPSKAGAKLLSKKVDKAISVIRSS